MFCRQCSRFRCTSSGSLIPSSLSAAVGLEQAQPDFADREELGERVPQPVDGPGRPRRWRPSGSAFPRRARQPLQVRSYPASLLPYARVRQLSALVAGLSDDDEWTTGDVTSMIANRTLASSVIYIVNVAHRLSRGQLLRGDVRRGDSGLNLECGPGFSVHGMRVDQATGHLTVGQLASRT